MSKVTLTKLNRTWQESKDGVVFKRFQPIPSEELRETNCLNPNCKNGKLIVVSRGQTARYHQECRSEARAMGI